MRGINIRMQEADRHRFHSLSLEHLRGSGYIFRDQRYDDLALRVQPLCYFEAQISRNQRLRFFEEQVERFRLDLAGDLQDVAEALRYQEGAFRRFAFDDAIRRDSRAVNEICYIGGLPAN